MTWTATTALRRVMTWTSTYPRDRPWDTAPPVDTGHWESAGDPNHTLCGGPKGEGIGELPAYLVLRAQMCAECERVRLARGR